MPEPATESIATYLDSSWHRDLLDELCAIERPSASPGEREAAEWLVAQLAALGVDARLRTEPAHGTFWWPLGLAAAGGIVAGGLALRGRRLLGAALAGGSWAAAIDDLPPRGRRTLRGFLPKGERTEVVAEIGPPDAEHTIVVGAHHDAAHCGHIFNPEIPEAVERRFPGSISEGPRTSPPLIGAPVATLAPTVALGALTGSRLLIKTGIAGAVAGIAVLADIGARPVSPGANDNGTAVVALLALARALTEAPLENCRVLLLSTSEEALCDGMQAFCEREAATLPRGRTFFLSIDSVGSPHLLVLRGEGMLRMRDYPPESLALLDGLAEELGIWLYPGLRTMNATDGVVPLAAGHQCASISSVTRLKQIANYHWPTDTPEKVDYGTLADSIRLAEATIRRLDERWF